MSTIVLYKKLTVSTSHPIVNNGMKKNTFDTLLKRIKVKVRILLTSFRKIFMRVHISKYHKGNRKYYDSCFTTFHKN